MQALAFGTRLVYNRKRKWFPENGGLGSPQKRVRKASRVFPWIPLKRGLFGRAGSRNRCTQNWVRRRNGYALRARGYEGGFSNALTQNWVRKWDAGSLLDAELGTVGAGKGFGDAEGVPNSARITCPQTSF